MVILSINLCVLEIAFLLLKPVKLYFLLLKCFMFIVGIETNA